MFSLDRENDRRSTKRRGDQILYLIFQHRNKSWNFAQGRVMQKDGSVRAVSVCSEWVRRRLWHPLISSAAPACSRQASERHVKAKCGADFEVYFPGNAPMGGSFCVCAESRPAICANHEWPRDYPPGFYFNPLKQTGKKKQSHYGVKVTSRATQTVAFQSSWYLTHWPAIAGVPDAVNLLEWRSRVGLRTEAKGKEGADRGLRVGRRRRAAGLCLQFIHWLSVASGPLKVIHTGNHTHACAVCPCGHRNILPTKEGWNICHSCWCEFRLLCLWCGMAFRKAQEPNNKVNL